MKKDFIGIVLYRIIILFIVFDGLRDNLIISSYLSPMKESSVLLLFIYILIKNKMILLLPKNIVSINFILFFMIVLVFSVFVFFHYHYNIPYVTSAYFMYYKIIQFFILFYIFTQYEYITNEKYENILNFFLLCLIFFSLMTPVIYYLSPWFMVDSFKQWGRINIGYPTMDAENLVMGILLLLFVFRKRFISSTVLLMMFLLTILMQNTATGYISLLMVLFYYFITNKKNKKNRASFYVVFILIILCISFILIQYNEVFELQIDLLFRKINAIFDPSNSKSLNMREEEFLLVKPYLNDWFSNLFGIGFNVYLENQYDYNRASMGIIGYSIFILFLTINIIYGFIIRYIDKSILFLSSILFGITSYSLITLYLFPTEGLYAMMIGYSIHLQYRKKIAINNRL